MFFSPFDSCMKKGSGVFFLVLTALFALTMAGPAAAAAKVTVTPAQGVIMLPAQPTAIEVQAAAELAKHLALITDVDMPIVKADASAQASADEKRFVFHVGIRPESDHVPFVTDEARWRVTPAGAWFYGGDRFGTQFAVYDFLESQLGVRWIEPGDRGIAYTKQPTLELETTFGQWQPRFMFRKIRQATRKIKTRFKVPARIEEFKDFNYTVAQHNAITDDEVMWQHRMRMSGSRPGGAHAFSHWWEEYGQSRPELFALTEEGKRAPLMLENRTKKNSEEWIKVCVSNPEVAKLLIEKWLPRKDVLKYVSTGPNDGVQGWCQCDACMALDTRKPGEALADHLTDRYIHLTNEVARLARQQRPDAEASLYAYLSTLQPPRREKLEPNIVVHIVPYLDPMDLETNKKLFEGWHQAGATKIAFRPNYHGKYVSGVMPLGIEKQMYDVFQQAVQYGAISFDYDSLTARWPVDGLMNYVLAKAMADPLKPFEYWVDHYAQAFGPAGDDVKDYFRYWRQEVWEKRLEPNMLAINERGGSGTFARGLMWSLGDYYKPEDFKAAAAILQRAASHDLSLSQKQKLDQLILATEHARLVYEAVVAPNIKKREPAKKLVAFRREHKNDLSFNWLGVFSHEITLGDITGLKLSQMADDYIDPWIATDETWQFKLDPQDQGLNENWQKLGWDALAGWEKISTTAFWENQAQLPSLKPETQEKLAAKYDGKAWYATQIDIPDDYKGKAIYLRFGAVDESCWVFLNGQKAGEHIYKLPDDWKTPFEIRIDHLIDWQTDKQTVVVRVEDRAGVGGIWKPVWIVTKNPTPTPAPGSSPGSSPATKNSSRGHP